MSEVRAAMHVRAGQRSACEALDAWLTRAGVDVLGFDDVYAACVHLLRGYERVPDLALVGVDWLDADELRIVTFIRQTWPHAGIVVYGAARDLPLFDFLPLTLTCRGEAAVARLLSGAPRDVLHALRRQVPSLAALSREQAETAPTGGPATPAVADAPDGAAEVVQAAARRVAGRSAPAEAVPTLPAEPGRGVLTAAELSALLDGPARLE